MTGQTPRLFIEDAVVDAWANALMVAHNSTNSDAPPLLISIRGGESTLPSTSDAILLALDTFLTKKNLPISAASAFTIFPYRVWLRRNRPGVEEFSKLCIHRLYPRMKKLNRRNQYGTYFQRMMAYPDQAGKSSKTTNQLAHVIGLMKQPKKIRESALQISILHPAIDHTGQPVRGFPCLQQVGVSYLDDGFALNAFYPTQYIVDRGLGNYIGLTHLGLFIQHETNRPFIQLNCYVGSPSLGKTGKGEIATLVSKARRRLDSNNRRKNNA